MEIFSNWLREWVFVKKQWNVNEFARQAGIHSSNASEYLNAKKLPNPATSYKIAEALGIDPDEVLEAAGHRTPINPEKEWDKVTDPELRPLLTAKLLNNLSDGGRNAIISILKGEAQGLETRIEVKRKMQEQDSKAEKIEKELKSRTR